MKNAMMSGAIERAKEMLDSFIGTTVCIYSTGIVNGSPELFEDFNYMVNNNNQHSLDITGNLFENQFKKFNLDAVKDIRTSLDDIQIDYDNITFVLHI
jgi:hypothetical protein